MNVFLHLYQVSSLYLSSISKRCNDDEQVILLCFKVNGVSKIAASTGAGTCDYIVE